MPPAKKIHCVGALVVDLLSGPIKQYPVPRVQTQVTTEWIRVMPGGGAANTPSALARMGLAVSSFSKVGDDLNGQFIRGELSKLGIDTSGIRVSRRDSTPFTFVGIHADGDRTFIHTPGANVTFNLSDLDLEKVAAADYLLYHDLWVLPGMDGKPAAELLEYAQKRGAKTLLDEGFGYGPKREPLEAMLPYCDYAIPSFDDLQAVYPGTTAEDLVKRLLDQGPRTVVLKMGQNGCLVAWGSDRVRVPIFPAKVVDTTGAGDCWDAGFIAGLASGEDLVAAAKIGNACAAFCIEAVGGATGVPSYEAVRQRAARAV
ncbi:MAG TPA: carbohydrate kinase family protein [Terriglobia bacterium]|nr:carbohydrate kinase family protein [Terriglobia bacterium]